ncbi:MAG: DUF484 family protein [Proteobacteria bacterium]|nr:DUF484 family protein [Pseudomonadota bacterium]
MPAVTKNTNKNIKLTPKQVLSYLQANPKFFESHKESLSTLSVPKKGGNILSLHALKADKISRHAENLQVRQKQLIHTAAANATVADTIFTATLQLIRCRTLAALRKYLQTGLPTDLALDATRLFTAAPEETATTLTPHQIEALCPTPVTLAPMDAANHRPIFGPKTNQLASVCLMQLTNEQGQTIGLLALGSAEAERFHAGQATHLANFLRQVTSTVLHNATHG